MFMCMFMSVSMLVPVFMFVLVPVVFMVLMMIIMSMVMVRFPVPKRRVHFLCVGAFAVMTQVVLMFFLLLLLFSAILIRQLVFSTDTVGTVMLTGTSGQSLLFCIRFLICS